MISVLHFSAGAPDFQARAQDALDVLCERPGFVRGRLGRDTDDPTSWVLITEWENVGSYRRALGHFEVKVRATPLLGEADDRPSTFESLVDVLPGATSVHASDRA